MENPLYALLLGILAVWRITHLLQAEDGPWELVVRLRAHAGSGWAGQLMDCFYCLSLWIALPFALLLGASASERVLLWPALSAGAILLERVTGGSAALSAPIDDRHEEAERCPAAEVDANK
ncbi:MAG: DUF1360 domain-containing protein [Candidatus Accumulibacter sp. UW26]